MTSKEKLAEVFDKVDNASIELSIDTKALNRLILLIVEEQFYDENRMLDVDALVTFANGIVSGLERARENISEAWHLLNEVTTSKVADSLGREQFSSTEGTEGQTE